MRLIDEQYLKTPTYGSRSSVYYVPVEPEAEELELMRRIDEIHLEYPFYGSRTIARELREKGYRADGSRVGGPEAEHQQAERGASRLPVPIEGAHDQPAEPGVGGRHHLRSHGPRVYVPGGGHGLA